MIKYEIQYKTREKKQFQQCLMSQFTAISLIIVLLHIVYSLYVQVHEPVLIFVMHVMQCEIFSMLIFHRMTFAVDNLFEVSLFTSLLAALTIIIDGIGSIIVNVNEFKCGYDRNNNITMIVVVLVKVELKQKLFELLFMICTKYQLNHY